MLSTDDIFVTLKKIPVFTETDRLYIDYDGYLNVDYTYTYTGTIGRTLMNMCLTGYNRNAIVMFYERLISSIKQLVYNYSNFTNTPYAIGNYKVFGIVPINNDKYTRGIDEIKSHIGKLDKNLTVLLSIYEYDTRILDRISKIQYEYKLLVIEINSLRIFKPMW